MTYPRANPEHHNDVCQVIDSHESEQHVEIKNSGEDFTVRFADWNNDGMPNDNKYEHE